MQVQVSAVIITYNEERNIERCILSLKEIVDEIVVVDSFSSDRTKELCLKHNTRFLEHAFEGHIEQKNWAKKQASFDYVLSLDADEALDENLQASILRVKKDWKADAYRMNRLTNYCGKWIHHSGWYPDTKTRLFDRRKGEWGGTNPHDKFLPYPGTRLDKLEGDLLHYSYYNRQEHLNQIEKFSSIGARSLYEKGVRSTLLKMLIKPLARFLKAYVVHKGYLDGKEGFVISRLSAYANFLKYRKLYLLGHGKTI
jgi:glycosyltransferase involved in cell wall biosynthesis